MTTSRVEMDIPNAERLSVSEDTLSVELSDGRSVSVPLAWFPRLLHGTAAERDDWRLIGRGISLYVMSAKRLSARVTISVGTVVSKLMGANSGTIDCLPAM